MIQTEYFWHIVFMLGAGTIAIRFSIIAISARIEINARTKEVFSFIPAAIIPALVAPIVFFHEGNVSLVFGKERFVILVFATIVCYFTRSTLATIVFGLVTLFVVS